MQIRTPLIALSLLVLFAGGTSAMAQSNATPEHDHASLIERFETGLRPRYGTSNEDSPVWSIEERMAFHKVPALSIAVAIDGQLQWARAYGEIVQGSNRDVNTKTLFQAASLSKPVASVAALDLVAREKLALDQPVNEFLTSWQIPSSPFTEQTPVTLRHLLSHRAGTTIHGFRGYRPVEPIPTSIEIVQGMPPANTDAVVVNKLPGEGYRYSGGGFQIVQLLIEDITKEAFPDIVRDAVFEPLSLSRSNYAYPQPDRNAAIGHRGENSTPIDGSGFIYPEFAAAGLWTTPTELVLLGCALSKDRTGAELLLPRELATQLIPDSADEAGLGFGLNNDGDGVAFVHNGHNPGFSARWVNYADGRASVAVLTNADTGGELIREVLSGLGHIYGWKQDAYVERETIELSPNWVDDIVGQYFFDSTSTTPAATITREYDQLWIEGQLTTRTRLYPLSSNEFFIANGLNMKLLEGETEVSFVLDIEGELELEKAKQEP